MVTLKDVAREAGVSVSTASVVINDRIRQIPISDDTRSRVMEVARRLRYHPNIFARSLRTNNSGIVGVVVENVVDPYFSGFIDGIEQELVERGYYLILSSCRNRARAEDSCLEWVRASRADGLLVVTWAGSLPEAALTNLLQDDIRVVTINREIEKVSCVMLDDVMGGYLATEHLVGQGCHRICHVTSRERTAESAAKLRGYQDCLNRCERVPWVERVAGTAESGFVLMQRLIRGGRMPDGVFAFNDMVALGMMTAIGDGGLSVPNDVAVVGYNDIPIARYFSPSLTTIRQPQREMGRTAAAALVRELRCGSAAKPSKTVFQPQLVVRQSCGGSENKGPGK